MSNILVISIYIYTLQQINSWTLKISQFIVETNLISPMTGRVYVNLLVGILYLLYYE